ncbi:hypothetical protein TL16_g02553 [Triparma laevis f. inornata]|uniref:Phosducin domain-containing protein n=2 Tax=Triparma laevis TaxID=1534972 RepID=A0A9W7FSM5_9STRA|nr:hypothetical protein TL16_g02553 [Triparma laevis f. inornata]GMI18307.1 hypothetical protein TrLO_g8650 [Triparma laevis f. longispina]
MSNLINYDGLTPNHQHSGTTTDFEDALIKHDVIDKRQALGNKGMTEEQITRTLEKDAQDLKLDTTNYHHDLNSDSDDDLLNDLDDDEFLSSYRKQRLQEIKVNSAEKAKRDLNRFNGVDEISRDEWASAVNGVSEDGTWVVVNLEHSGNNETKNVTECLKNVADRFGDVKFLRIDWRAAIENWPEANLPTVFCYRNGELQKQMISAKQSGGPHTTVHRLEWRLKLLGVLPDSELEEDGREIVKKVNVLKIDKMSRKGGVGMETWGDEDDEDAGND